MAPAVVPVVAAYGGVRQTRVTRDVDAVGVSVELGGAATAAGVGDVAAQRRHYTVQWCGALQDGLWCILGRSLEVEGSDLNPELHFPWRR